MTSDFIFIIFSAVVFLILLSMVNYFIFLLKKACPVFALHPCFVKIFYLPVLLIFFLFYNRTLEGSLRLTVASYLFYIYFTVLFVFFIYGLFFELLIFIRRKKFRKRKTMFLIIISISLYTVITGLYFANDIKVEHFDIRSPKITKPVRIVQISDTHFSATVGTEFALKIRDMVNELKPDAVILTGDFMDYGINDPESISKAMREINAPLGKFAISGNHEFINGFNQAADFIKWSGFSFIYTGKTELNREIELVAVTDRSVKMAGWKTPDDIETLKKADPSKFIIFLKHQPSLKDGTWNYFDLMLSGHTHAGQIFPFDIFVKIAFPYFSGNYKFSNGSILHVSRGTGTWGPPVRFGAMPEITLIELVHGN